MGSRNALGVPGQELPLLSEPSRTLFVRNVDPVADEADLKQIFEVWSVALHCLLLSSASCACNMAGAEKFDLRRPCLAFSATFVE